MLRIALLVVALVLLVALLRGALRRKPPAPPTPPGATSGTSGTTDDTLMIACAHCGVHLPRNEAIEGARGALFCGEPHRVAHAEGRPPAP